MTVTTTAEGFLTLAEAADLLHLCKRSVERMTREDPMREGSIPFYDLKPGRRRRCLRFLESDLVLWVELGSPPAADFVRIKQARRRGKGGAV